MDSKSPERKRTAKRSKSKQLATPPVNVSDLEYEDLPTQFHTLSVKDCKLARVTVFNDRAELVRRVTAPLVPGKWDVVVTGLPEKTLDQHSIRVSAVSEGFLVEEVGDHLSYPEVKTDEVRQELADAQLAHHKLEIEKDVLSSRLRWLEEWSSGLKTGNAKPSPADALTADGLANVAQFLEFYCREKSSTQLSLYNLNLKLAELAVKLEVLKAKLSGGKDGRDPNRTVTVSLRRSEHGDDPVVFDLSYVLRGAAWTPRYDCRVTQPRGTTGQIDLTYFGLISNKTGEDWTDTELLLSTARPSSGGEPQVLRTAKVDFLYGSHVSRSRKLQIESNFIGTNPLHVSPRDEPTDVSPSVRTAKLGAGASGAGTTFIIPRRATISADDRQHKVTITKLSLDAVYSCVCSPRAELAIYRKATMQNSSDFPLLPGAMTVFVNNNLLTTNSLPQTNPREVFFVFLGRDEALRCKYKLDKKDQVQASTGMVFKARSENFKRTVEIRNTSEVAEVITIYEQIPVANDDRIKVKINEPECLNGKKELPDNVEWAKVNDSNHLEYRVLVPPDSTHNIKVHFTVEWPADQDINYTW